MCLLKSQTHAFLSHLTDSEQNAERTEMFQLELSKC